MAAKKTARQQLAPEQGMRPYLDLLADVLENGVERDDRTGVGTLALFGKQVRYDLSKGFPLLTTKRLHVKSIVHELLWFIRGETNVSYLKEHGVSIWDEWAGPDGDLGPIYGRQWRNWKGPNGKSHDQLSDMIRAIKETPQSRRIIMSSWNVGELEKMHLFPCHVLTQAWVADGKLSLQLYQRSADLFLGVPFNIASYSLLTHMLAHVTGLKAVEMVHTFGDVHLYKNHIEQAKTQLARKPHDLPTLKINPKAQDIMSIGYDDIVFENYNPHPKIEAKVAV